MLLAPVTSKEQYMLQWHMSSAGMSCVFARLLLRLLHCFDVSGYGTYKVGVVPASASSAVAAGTTDTETVNPADCVANALKLGYRFLDCAEFYANEKSVGEGIAKSGVPRSELYLASKVWTTTIHAGPAAVQAQLEKTLADLGTDYLDLYCIHWPVPGKHVDAYLQLEKAKAAGLIRSIGVSNYAIEDFTELMETATVTPVINQVGALTRDWISHHHPSVCVRTPIWTGRNQPVPLQEEHDRFLRSKGTRRNEPFATPCEL